MSGLNTLVVEQEMPAALQTWQGSCILYQPDDAVIREVMQLMKSSGYNDRDVMSIRLAMEEAIVNAHLHGNRGDARKPIRVNYDVTPRRVVAQVEDEGDGFDPDQVPDPTRPENLDREHGRGVALMRSYMTQVQFNRRGNCVTLCKCPSYDSTSENWLAGMRIQE